MNIISSITFERFYATNLINCLFCIDNHNVEDVIDNCKTIFMIQGACIFIFRFAWHSHYINNNNFVISIYQTQSIAIVKHVGPKHADVVITCLVSFSKPNITSNE